MKKLKIYIASTESALRIDRMEIGDFFRKLNNFYLDKGLYFSLLMNDSENKEQGLELADSDLAFFLFLSETDDAALRELEDAFKCFRKDGRPKISVYFKSGGLQTKDTAQLKEKLVREADCYYNTYGHIDTLKLGILMQIKQLDLERVDIRLEYGKAMQGGETLLSLDNVEMVSGYEELQRLKEERAELEGLFYATKTSYAENPEDNAAYEAFYEAARRRNEAEQGIRGIETRLYHMIEGMYEQTARGKLSKRQVEGYRLMERGKFREAQAILDFDGIVSESRHDDEMADLAAKRAQVHVNEQLQLKDVNETLGDWQGVDACYREAERLEEKHNLPRKASTEYLRFLGDQKHFEEGITLGEKLRHYYMNPANAAPGMKKARFYLLLGRLYGESNRMGEAEKTLKPGIEVSLERENREDRTLVQLYNALGLVYKYTMRIKESEEALQSAIDLCHHMTEQDPEENDYYVSNFMNNLGDLYLDTQRMEEAENLHLEVLEIRKKLYARDHFKYGYYLALSYECLGAIYVESGRYDEAVTTLQSGLKIQVEMAAQNPEAYEAGLALIYYNLGEAYRGSGRFAEAEAPLKCALEIYERHSDRDGSGAYDMDSLRTYTILGGVYTSAKRYQEAESALKSAMGVFHKSKAENFEVAEQEVYHIYNNLGTLYRNTGRYEEAEANYDTALEITKRLSAINPDGVEAHMADIMANEGELYQTTGRAGNAEEVFREALRIYEKYAAYNPLCMKRAAETREKIKNLREAAPGVAWSMAMLTPEEREIAVLLTEGETQRDIARKLRMSAVEVSKHVSAIREKVISVDAPDPFTAAIVRDFRLSRREEHILRCLRRNMTNGEIAAELFISEETVRVHVHNLIKKLPVKSRQEIATWNGTKG